MTHKTPGFAENDSGPVEGKRPHGPHKHPHGPRHAPHEHPHHRRPHGPGGLHLIPQRIEEMRRRGAPEMAIQEILESFKDKLPRGVLKTLHSTSPDDLAVKIGKTAEAANDSALESISRFSDGGILIAGELPPHIIGGLLDSDIKAIQVCDPSPHGHRPPHLRDLAACYPRFSGVMSLTEVSDDSAQIIVLHAFMPDADSVFVCPLALMATRLWPQAKVVAVISDHRAPHHVAELRRSIDEFLFWE